MKPLTRLILVCLSLAVSALKAQTTTTTADPTTATTATSTTTTTTTSSTTGAATPTSATTSGNLLTSSALVVYKLTFEPAGETINYRPYQGGYYIAPIEGGTGSLILTLTTGGVKTFYTYSNFGELFVAVKYDDRKVVLSATAANTVSTTTFFAIGDANERRNLETRSSDGDVFTAKLLKGYAVSADSEKDLPYSSSSANDIGVAGVSYLRATLDEGLTQDAINNNRTLSAEVTVVQTLLTDDGYTNGSTTNSTSASGSGATGTGTAAQPAANNSSTSSAGTTATPSTTTAR